MEERPLQSAWRSALAEREWEPPEGWIQRVHAERLRRIKQEILAVLALVVVAAVLTLVWGAPRSYMATGGLVAASIVRIVYFATRRDRAPDDATKDRLRVDHALRRHESVGVAHRDRVTSQAQESLSLSRIGIIAAPVMGAITLWLVVIVDRPQGRAACLLLTGLSVIWLVAALRSAARARRWLADPLPRP